MRHLTGPVILLCIVAGFHWKLFTTQYTWMDHPDMANQVLPWLQFQAASWHDGELPLWDPHLWGGQPLAGQLQPGAAYPLNWPLFLLPLKDGYLQQRFVQWSFVLAHVFAAWFAYWLARDLGRSRAASILAGSAFALGGVIGSLGWPQMLNSAIWLPLVVLFLLRSRAGPRRWINAVWSGTFLGIAFLAGHHQIPTLILLTVSGWWVYQLWRERLHAAPPAIAFFLATFLTGGLQLLPAYAYGVRAIRFVGLPYGVAWNQNVPYTVHEQYSLFPREVLGLVLPHVTNQDVFMGLAVLTLAFLAAYAYRTVEVKTLLAFGAGGLLVALGGLSVFHGVLYATLPGFDKVRSPVMAMVIVQFALAMLAGYGVDALRDGLAGRWWTRALTILGIAPWPLLAAFAIVREEASREYERLAVFGLVALVLAAILHASRSREPRPASLAAFLILLTLFELGTVTGQNYHQRDTPAGFLSQLGRDRDIAEFLRKQPDFVRLEVDVESLPYNFGDWEGIDQMQGSLPSVPINVARYFGEPGASSNLGPKLFALTHFAGEAPIRADQEEIYRSASGLVIFRNPDVMPRVWTVHESVNVAGNELIERILSGDPRRQVFLLDETVPLQQCPETDDVRVGARSNNTIELEVDMGCTGIVVLSETYFPGWQASVDGRPARIHEAYGVLRGVVVEAGAHRVVLSYRPGSVLAGGTMTALGIGLALLLALWRPPSASAAGPAPQTI